MAIVTLIVVVELALFRPALRSALTIRRKQ
jgi:hypothetical protein